MAIKFRDATENSPAEPASPAPAPAPAPVPAPPSGVVEQQSEFAVWEQVVTDSMNVVADLGKMMDILSGLQAEAMNLTIMHSAQTIENPGSHKSQEMRLRSLRAEFAQVLNLSERTVEARLVVSEYLVKELPTTLAALKLGEISYRHAQIMVDQILTVEPEDRAALEEKGLPFARPLTAAKFDRKLRALRESIAPETMVARREKAAEDREVTIQPDGDGMAWLNAYLPAPVAQGVFQRLTEMARSLQTVEEQRTLTQLRADVFSDVLLDGEITSCRQGIRAKVFVTVPVLTLLGKKDIPASLDGYGPIDAETARELAGTAKSFVRLLTHPETGAVLSVGKDSYTVPQDLRNWLRVRDRTCRFPGCSRDASLCDIDHSFAWASGGETRHDNLAHLCKSHHALKHAAGWRVKHANGGGGTLTWTSPAGRNYTTEPEVRMRT